MTSGGWQAIAAPSLQVESNPNQTTPQQQSPEIQQLPTLPPIEKPKPSANPTTQEVRLVLKLKKRRVYVYRSDNLETSYPVAIGKPGWETPTGSFQVLQMIRNPSWQHPWKGTIVPPGDDNPLGRRWIAFWYDEKTKNSIGFHGTPNERLIGQAVSHGCVRMRNKDVEALFEKVAIGTPVTVEQ
ncbi:MAG: L,D-transpeptidase family protein [Cyanosarcina radialis HA8281-LM2]|jgi:lipoprotein-anchoring transpeptidase ErfK/SrfK|nr:L,D-transpeptidase family protein [Cyanosarcina radialis HA8281-LM2]